MTIIRPKLLLTLLTAVVIFQHATGQGKRQHQASFQKMAPLSNQTFSVGETIPDITVNPLINYPSNELKFSDLVRGNDLKLIILDFWATWCSSCIAHFEDAEQLKKKYGAQLDIILVNAKNTGDSKEKILRFLERRKQNNTPVTLPVAYLDTVLSGMFVHKMIPHYVWINQDLKVVAITGAEKLNEDNVSQYLKAGNLSLGEKKDIMDFNPADPVLLGNKKIKAESYTKSYTMLTGYIPGLPGGASRMVTDSAGMVTRVYSINVSLLSLIKQAYPESLYFPDNQIQIHSRLPVNPVGDWAYWKESAAFSYDSKTPPVTREQALQNLRNELQTTMGLSVTCQPQQIKGYVLAGNTQKIKARTVDVPEDNMSDEYRKETKLTGQELKKLVHYINFYSPVPVTSSLDPKEKITIRLPKDLTDTTAVFNTLRKAGLTISTREITLPVLQITDKRVLITK